MKSKILLFDVETAPLLGTAWQTYETNLVWLVKDWYMLGFSWKWLGDSKVHVLVLPSFKRYKKDPEDDSELVKCLGELLGECDVAVAHNGDRFDVRKTNARLIINGLDRPMPYKTVDTLKVARKHFAFTSNKLDDLGDTLGVGRKLKTDKELWKACMHGDMKAWRQMARYNKQDVLLLERVYLKLRPWMTNHPAVNVIEKRPKSCPVCGGERVHKIAKYEPTKTNRKQYYRCYDCKSMVKSRIPENQQAYQKMEYTS